MSDHEHSPGVWRRHGLRIAATGQDQSPRPWRVLVVSSELAWIDRVVGLLATVGMQCVCAATLGLAKGRRDASFDAALIDLDLADGSGLDLADLLARTGTVVVMSTPEATLENAAAAAAAGARDLLGRDIKGRQLIERMMGAVTRVPSKSGRPGLRCHRDPRAGGTGSLSRLSGLCGRPAHPDTLDSRQRPEQLDDQLPVRDARSRAGARWTSIPFPESEDPMSQVTIANEFGGLIRHELDIESLLRTTLEFVLAKCGPTNAAVFLPTTSGDFSLGAYVNYDCPKETVDVLLDHLANAVAPRFEDRRGIAHLTDERSLHAAIGDDAGWLEDSAVVAFACRHDDEALAICMLFRDRATPYPSPLLEQLRTIGELFAAQLARVIRIHHRHLPKDKWGAIGDTDDHDESDGYGGGLAA